MPGLQTMRRLSRRNSRRIADTTSSADRNAIVLTSYLPDATPAAGGTASFFSLCGERRGEFFRHRHVLQPHIVGQAVLEGWIGFANDKRGQVAASRLRDTKAISADKVVGQQLLPIGDLGQGR